MTHYKIALVLGSLRRDSFNRQLGHAVVKLAPPGFSFHELRVDDLLVDLRTSIGLRLRAVGEHPRAAETVGISVYKTRYVAVVVSGILAALRRRLPVDRDSSARSTKG